MGSNSPGRATLQALAAWIILVGLLPQPAEALLVLNDGIDTFFTSILNDRRDPGVLNGGPDSDGVVLVAGTGWQIIQLTTVTAFMDGAGTRPLAEAGILDFGFTFHSFVDLSAGLPSSPVLVVDFDNLRVEVELLPEPGAMTLLLGCLVAALCLRQVGPAAGLRASLGSRFPPRL